ncbi:MAG: hypothetical protein JRH06_15575 [Deltaproteobacteria bacterium]|nr:hypothetical protein [Deltaproteobacteria bacterium]MBW2138958.1 hypothetical protein [Deltaproteobacteria bacterium]
MELSKSANNDLTDDEQSLFVELPGPPVTAVVRSTNIWIIEWLPQNEQRTGRLLHEWMQEHRPGWSLYSSCEHKDEVLSSIEHATRKAKKYGMIPVLHLEAHGNEMCLGLPNDNGNAEELTWHELIEPLQRLNLVTRCNLVLVVAACIGFAGIKAFVRGPRAPAVALIGPSAPIMSGDLFSWTKEFYKLWMAGNSSFSDIAANATGKAGEVSFAWEPFAVLAYDAMAKQVIISMRPDEQLKQVNRFRQRMAEENRFSAEEIENRLSLITPSLQVNVIQRLWDEMFMIDLYPENRERFGVDWSREFEMISVSKCLNRGT